ncbi:PIN domain-containing protein [Siphonobacter aquaeclarae]|uniref:DUF4935 domain-containing protein n=1 Tax=Siphonobacter aquaeclarae TaxID=563176 RepID=A0A1G9HGC3_9BACT|nr:PIN domain-containing protein [Siphonobacter aquaeclarae]SDL12040.1 hypothetical protein SAMN04488090_0047 [Siphonobacter aquaeclarae]
MKFLIDTNIYLDFYRYNNESIQLLNSLTEHSDKIILIDQIIDEFHRNREKILNELKGLFMKDSKLENIPSSLLNDTSEYKELIKIQKQYEDQRNKVRTAIERFIDSETHDPVAFFFNELTNYAIKNDTLLKMDDFILANAEKRKLKGNPPTSQGKASIGDEINWELILNNTDDDIIIICRDGSFKTHIAVLKKEYHKHTGRFVLGITSKISEAFKIADIKIDPKLKTLEDRMIRELPDDYSED